MHISPISFASSVFFPIQRHIAHYVPAAVFRLSHLTSHVRLRALGCPLTRCAPREGTLRDVASRESDNSSCSISPTLSQPSNLDFIRPLSSRTTSTHQRRRLPPHLISSTPEPKHRQPTYVEPQSPVACSCARAQKAPPFATLDLSDSTASPQLPYLTSLAQAHTRSCTIRPRAPVLLRLCLHLSFRAHISCSYLHYLTLHRLYPSPNLSALLPPVDRYISTVLEMPS